MYVTTLDTSELRSMTLQTTHLEKKSLFPHQTPKVKVAVIPTNEELAICRDTVALVK